jgi:hypothetical protein
MSAGKSGTQKRWLDGGLGYGRDTAGAGPSVDEAVAAAQSLFLHLYPTEPFLPPAPNPEDVVYESPEEAAPG